MVCIMDKTGSTHSLLYIKEKYHFTGISKDTEKNVNFRCFPFCYHSALIKPKGGVSYAK